MRPSLSLVVAVLLGLVPHRSLEAADAIALPRTGRPAIAGPVLASTRAEGPSGWGQTSPDGDADAVRPSEEFGARAGAVPRSSGPSPARPRSAPSTGLWGQGAATAGDAVPRASAPPARLAEATATDIARPRGPDLPLGRSIEERARDRLNVRDAPFLARGDGVADDSGAIARAIEAANARARAFQQVCLYLPGGRYRIAATRLPTFDGNGCLEGDGTNQTYITVDRGYSGDVFSWDEAWLADDYFVDHSRTIRLQGQRAGPRVQGLTVVGDTAAPNIQNAFMFYDRADFVSMRDVDALFIHGRCFATGITKNVRTSAMRESMFDGTRFWACGTPTLPAVEIGSDGLDQDDATDEIDWRNLSIVASNGPGLVIRNRGGNLLRDIRIQGLRVEGPTGIRSAGDLIRIGDPAHPGRIADVSIRDLQTNGSQAGFAALTIAAATAVDQPYAITVEGTIGNGAGRGLDIQAGRGLRFDLRGIATADTAVTVGPTPLVGSDILLNAWGQERYFSYRIDPSALPFFHTPGPFKVGDPSRPFAQALVSKVHDSSPSGGFPPGEGAVDLQVANSGTDASRVGQGQASVVVGGFDNRAGGSYAVQVGGQSNVDDGLFGVGVGGQGNLMTGYADTIAGGTFNTLSGAQSGILGGSQATDRGRTGWQGFAGGKIARQGDAQAGVQLLRMAGSGVLRLTADGAAPGPTVAAGACAAIPDSTAYGVVVTLEAIDTAAPATRYAARWTAAHDLTRGIGTGSTRVDGGVAAVAPDSARGQGSAAISADTTNGCLDVRFIPPNRDAWHAVAKVETVEVQ